MKRFIISALIVLVNGSLFCQSLYLDEAIQRLSIGLSDELSSQISPTLAILGFPTVKGEHTELGNYIAKKFNNSFSKNELVKPIEQDMVNLAVTEKYKDYNEIQDYNHLNQFSEKIFQKSGIVPQIYLWGKIEDLDEKIIISAKLVDAKTTRTITGLSTEVKPSALTDRLLGKPVSHPAEDEIVRETDTVVIEKEKIVEVPVVQEKIVEKIIEVPVDRSEELPEQTYLQPEDPEVFYHNDFSNYNNGDYAPEWGANVLVIERNDHRKYLTSQVKGSHTVSQKINFPENFSFQFEYLRGRFETEVVLIDSNDQQLRFLLKQFSNNFVVFPNMTEKSTGVKETNEFRLVKNGSTYKVYMNGEYMLSYDDPKFKDFKLFKIRIPESRYFTNFLGKQFSAEE